MLGTIDSLLGRKANKVIFCYHSIGNSWKFSVSKRMFEKQIQFIKKTHVPLKVSEILQSKLSHAFAISLDDGYQDNLSIKEFCEQNNIFPTVYVLSLPEKASRETLGNDLNLLTTPEINQLLKKGWEVGCHTLTHAILPSKSAATLEKEIVYAKSLLEKKIGKKVTSFAYPKGKYSERVMRMVQKAGYQNAVTMDDNQLNKGTNPYLIPRVGVDGSHSFREFAYLCSPSVIAFRSMVKHSPFGRYF